MASLLVAGVGGSVSVLGQGWHNRASGCQRLSISIKINRDFLGLIVPSFRLGCRPVSALLLVVSGLTMSSAAWACGGGGSGAYRKPLRPDQVHQHNVSSLSQPSAPTSSQPETQTPASSR